MFRTRSLLYVAILHNPESSSFCLGSSVLPVRVQLMELKEPKYLDRFRLTADVSVSSVDDGDK